VHKALPVAYAVVAVELVTIAWVRKRFLRAPLAQSLVQVTMAGVLVAGVGIALGHA
jgi:erythrin-vacuolar iron transport family protein